jgi:restriction endonuclease Mrr
MITHEDALLPILQVLAAGGVMDRRPLIEATANHMGVHEDDREVVLASGQAQFRNRIGWAMSFLKKAGLLTQPKRGQYEIAAAGQQVVDSGTDRIDAAWLRENSDSFVAWVEEVAACFRVPRLWDRSQRYQSGLRTTLIRRLLGGPGATTVR